MCWHITFITVFSLSEWINNGSIDQSLLDFRASERSGVDGAYITTKPKGRFKPVLLIPEIQYFLFCFTAETKPFDGGGGRCGQWDQWLVKHQEASISNWLNSFFSPLFFLFKRKAPHLLKDCSSDSTDKRKKAALYSLEPENISFQHLLPKLLLEFSFQPCPTCPLAPEVEVKGHQDSITLAMGRTVCHQHHQQESRNTDLLLWCLPHPPPVLVVMVTRAMRAGALLWQRHVRLKWWEEFKRICSRLCSSSRRALNPVVLQAAGRELRRLRKYRGPRQAWEGVPPPPHMALPGWMLRETQSVSVGLVFVTD